MRWIVSRYKADPGMVAVRYGDIMVKQYTGRGLAELHAELHTERGCVFMSPTWCASHKCGTDNGVCKELLK